jgi:NADPH-dependent 2,4-dienoyl-CoA reductase/sulfur reductase-like enzyme
MSRERLVVIGADAAGMSAASQARKRRDEADLGIVAFERGRATSYSACGIPYWIGGAVDSEADLIARTPEQHRANGIDLRMRTEVVGIDLAARRVTARDLETGREYDEAYDSLVYATGSVPMRPQADGFDAPGVHGVQTLDDGEALIAELDSGRVERVVVVGGGYIGLELAEACQVRKLDVTVVDRSPTPIGTFDPDIGRFIAEAVAELGIRLVLGQPAARVETGPDGRAVAVHTADGQRLAADLVILGLGVRPNVALARAAGIPLGPSGGVAVDNRMRTQVDGVWSAGTAWRAGTGCPASGRWSPWARTPTSRAGSSASTSAAATRRSRCHRDSGHQGVRPGGGAHRDVRGGGRVGRLPLRHRARRLHHPGRLLPGREADPREAAGREAQRPPARRADRRP